MLTAYTDTIKFIIEIGEKVTARHLIPLTTSLHETVMKMHWEGKMPYHYVKRILGRTYRLKDLLGQWQNSNKNEEALREILKRERVGGEIDECMGRGGVIIAVFEHANRKSIR